MNVVSLSANGMEASLVYTNYSLPEEYSDDGFMVLWKLHQSDRYSLRGQAKQVALVSDLDGNPCLVLHVTGPCNLAWSNDGDSLEAVCDGQYWTIRHINYDRIEPYCYGV
jgi:hypothetical protein